MLLKRLEQFFISRLNVFSIDPDEGRLEYALKLNLLLMISISTVFTLLSVIGYFFSLILLDTFLIMLFLSLFFMAAWLMAVTKNWKKGRIIPVGTIYLVAVYGNFIGGIGAPAMLIYILAIILASQLYGKRMQFITIGASIFSFSVIALLHYNSLIPAQRAETAAFQNRVFIVISLMLMIGILLRFVINQLEEAVHESRNREQEIAATNKKLLAANEEFKAQNEELVDLNQEIAKSEYNFRSLFESSPIPVVLHRLGTILLVNKAFAQLTGGDSTDSLKGSSLINFLAPEDLERINGYIKARHLGQPVPSVYETSVVQLDGTKLQCEINVSSVIVDNETATLVFANDITDRKNAERENERMQKQLAQAQKMEAVGTLTGGIAHDFNNMLTGIMGSLSMLETLVDKKKQPEPDSLKKYIITAQESSRRAADMIKHLMTFSRKSELKLSAVDINLSLKHIQKICQNSFPKSINLDFTIGNVPLYIKADPVEIEQVLLNLCVNASHAMTFMRPEGENQGGTLSVSAKEIECSNNFCTLHQGAMPGENYVMVKVNDTGVGINEETRRQIFDPFFTTKSTYKGTGLGLTMVYGIVKQHGGFIDVYSEAGKGSVFNVYLPAAGKLASIENRDTATPRLVTGSGIILVIDDEKSILSVASGMLEQCGYQVMIAKNGVEGIEVYHREHQNIDAVLLDLSMPGMSGLEVFEEFKKTNPDVKVLLSSGLMEKEEIENALKIGIRGFIQKPYSVVDLSAKLKEVLEA